MADDFQVKQSSSSSGAYSLGGAVLGGVGAGAAAHYLTKPKYGSYEDIIKEAKDSTDFSSKIDKAEGEEKDFLKQAKEIAGKEKTVGEQWDAELKEYLEKNKDGLPVEDDAYKALVEKQTAAEKAYSDANTKFETQRNSYIQEKTNELKAKNSGELTEGQKKANEAFQRELEGKKNNLNNYITNRENAYKKVNSYISSSADANTSRLEQAFEVHDRRIAIIDDITEKLKLNDKNAKQKDRNYNFKKGTQIRLSNGKVVKLVPGKKLTEDEIALLKEQLADARKAANKALEDHIQSNPALKDSFGQIKDKTQRMSAATQARDAIVNTRQIAESADARQRFYDREFANYQREKANIQMSDTEFERNKKALEIKKGKIEKAQILRDAIRFEQLESYTTGTHKGRRVAGWLGFEYPNKLTDAQRQEYAQLKTKLAATPLTAEQKKEVEKLISTEGGYKGAFNKIDGELIGLQREINAMETKITAEATARQNVQAFERIMEGMSNPKGKLDLEVKVPVSGDKELEKLQKGIRQTEAKINIPGAGLSEAEITEQAGRYADEKLTEDAKKLADLKEKSEAAKKAVADAPKGGAATEADFAKMKGVKDKAEFVKNEVESSQTKFKEQFKKLLDRRYGFAEGAGWKIAGVAAAGALVVGAIASAFAPKDNA